MKIALLGYGKMGKAVEKVAIARGHEIVLRVTADSKSYDITTAQVAIDFSAPSAAVSNITNCLKRGIPIVSGTTGWLKDYDSIVELCRERDGAFLYASNFSLGVNLFFQLNKQLAQMMKNHDLYQASIEETHHTEKLDAPSGTAITLAEDLIKNSNYNEWQLTEDTMGSKDTIPIQAHREVNVPGTHQINYTSKDDKISIRHEAFGREGFALGAVMAAEWILGKTGIFSMQDVLNIG